MLEVPVILVGNKTDQIGDRMITTEEGQRRFKELSCACFHEISVRESVDQVSGLHYLKVTDKKLYILGSISIS